MRSSFLAVALVSMFGCGGKTAGTGGGGGGGASSGAPFTTSVGGSQSIGALSPSDQTQLCSDVTSYFSSDETPAVDCRVTAFATAAVAELQESATTAQLQAACSAAYEECLAEPSATDVDAGANGCDFSELTPTNCTATVDELSSCVTGLAGTINSIPTCSMVTAQSAGTGSEVLALGAASCETLDDECPGALSTSATTSALTAFRRRLVRAVRP